MKIDPGIVWTTTRLEVEDVRKAHSTSCVICRQLPIGRRVRVIEGSGQGQTNWIYCRVCGRKLLLWYAQCVGCATARAARDDYDWPCRDAHPYAGEIKAIKYLKSMEREKRKLERANAAAQSANGVRESVMKKLRAG